MTQHFFENKDIKLHYYKFGNGNKPMLCFHGFGMHGRQFKVLEEHLGNTYTFYGFDLFFHEKTIVKNQSLNVIKKGISKADITALFISFCDDLGIQEFSLLSYSMGSHYAATIVEEAPERVIEFISAAPSCLNAGWLITTLSRRFIGNKLLEKLSLSNNGMMNLLKVTKKAKIIDDSVFTILSREIETYELRFNFYACVTYLKHLKINRSRFITNLNQHEIKSIFIFGSRDWNYSIKIAKPFLPFLPKAEVLILEENHDMINSNFATQLRNKLNDY